MNRVTTPCWRPASIQRTLETLVIYSIAVGGSAMADDPKFGSFEFAEIEHRRAAQGQFYSEFLQTPSMHCGVYHLTAGSHDGQSPHDEDELYYVQSGVGKFWADDKDIDVKEGTIIYVKAHEKHYFHSIEEDLTILVVFSTHERPAAGDQSRE